MGLSRKSMIINYVLYMCCIEHYQTPTNLTIMLEKTLGQIGEQLMLRDEKSRKVAIGSRKMNSKLSVMAISEITMSITHWGWNIPQIFFSRQSIVQESTTASLTAKI